MKEEPGVKTEVLLPNLNESTDEASRQGESEEKKFDVKAEGEIYIKSEVPELECDATYDDSINLELLHEKLDLKIEILSNHEEQRRNEPFDNKLPTDSMKNPKSTSKSAPPFKCNICRSEFLQTRDLQQHKLIHVREKLSKCNICSYTSRYKHNLKRHMKTHSGEKPYKCTVCSFASAQQGDWKRHLRNHAAEKRFQCNECSYTCIHNGDLIRHMKIHTGERPFKCGICSFTCAHSGHLKRHMMTHTGEKPFQCYTCSSKFARKSTLRIHLTVHRKEKLLGLDAFPVTTAPELRKKLQ